MKLATKTYRRRFILRHLLVALGLAAMAGLLRFWIAPELERLPADYANETRYLTEDHFRDSPAGDWQITTLTFRRVDQTISNVTSRTAIVAGNLHVYAESGAVIFDSPGMYGVDRRTRANLPGYGDLDRTGQFLFPPHVEPMTYTYWDPVYVGPLVATFDRAETLNGLPVYVFHFSGTGMDETDGYSHLPGVPERYGAHTDGQGTLWIEPTSGILVDYEDQGVSYFVDPATGTPLADFHQWTCRYTPETRAAQLRLASAARRRILALEAWLPAGLVFIGLIWLALGLWLARRTRASEA